MTFGIISGCDKNYEWLLPWWWENYKKHNSYPVAIFDFGMSEEGKKFCIDRGIYYALPAIEQTIIPFSNLEEKNQSDFDIMYGGKEIAEKSRSAWFKKPQAANHTPFDTSAWIDLDCEICLNLCELEMLLDSKEEISLRIESEITIFILVLLNACHIDEITYNSGVIVFKKNSSIIKDWLDLSLNENSSFGGDQDALCRAIYLKNHPIKLLPDKFNKLDFDHTIPSREIRHFAGPKGKEKIKKIVKISPKQILI